MHGGIVERGGFVDVDIEAVVGFHLQGSLNAGAREVGPRPAAMFMAFLVEAVYLRQAALGEVVLLGVVVAGNPPGGVVACKGKLCQLLFEPEADQGVVDAVVAHGEFVAETQTVVI